MQNAEVQTDVIIVGAGPTGLSLAVQLIRYNINFVIFDQKQGVTDLSKALVVHARTLEIYDQMGLAQTAIASGERVQKGALMHDGKIRARIDFSDFGERLSPFPFMLIFEQSKNEQLLYDYLQRQGKAVQWQTELASLSQDAEGVRAVLKPAKGETQIVKARYLVGCDGASSATRHLLGLPFTGSTHPRLFYVADVQMQFEADAGTFYAPLGQDSFVLMVPMQEQQRWRLIGNLPEYEPQIEPDVVFEQVEAKLKQLVQRPLEITTVHWFSTYKVHTRRAEQFSLGNCFLAGDAAHVHTPAGGQGMNTGIQDAYNLAWKLAFVLRGDAKKSLLETYNEERLANAKRLLQTTDQFFDVAASDRWYFRWFRENILPSLAGFVTQFSAAKEFLFPMISQIGLDYHDSSLSQHQGDRPFEVKAGDRMPYLLVNGVSIYDNLREPKFHLLVFCDHEQADPSLQSEFAHTYSDWLDLSVVPLYPSVVKLFGQKQPFQVLLRPDNYIGLITENLDADPLKAYFENLLKRS